MASTEHFTGKQVKVIDENSTTCTIDVKGQKEVYLAK